MLHNPPICVLLLALLSLSIRTTLGGPTPDIIDWIEEEAGEIEDDLEYAKDLAAKELKKIADKLARGYNIAKDTAEDEINTISNGLTNEMEEVEKDLKERYHAVLDPVIKAEENFVAEANEVAGEVVEDIKEGYHAVVDPVIKAGETLAAKAKEVAGEVVEDIKEGYNFVKEEGETLASKAKEVGGEILEQVEYGAEEVEELADNTWTKVKGFFSSAWDSVTAFATKSYDFIVNLQGVLMWFCELGVAIFALFFIIKVNNNTHFLGHLSKVKDELTTTV